MMLKTMQKNVMIAAKELRSVQFAYSAKRHAMYAPLSWSKPESTPAEKQKQTNKQTNKESRRNVELKLKRNFCMCKKDQFTASNTAKNVCARALEERRHAFVLENFARTVHRVVVLDGGARRHHHAATNGVDGVRRQTATAQNKTIGEDH